VKFSQRQAGQFGDDFARAHGVDEYTRRSIAARLHIFTNPLHTTSTGHFGRARRKALP
jgi:hypothetical protein